MRVGIERELRADEVAVVVLERELDRRHAAKHGGCLVTRVAQHQLLSGRDEEAVADRKRPLGTGDGGHEATSLHCDPLRAIQQRNAQRRRSGLEPPAFDS